MKFDQPNAEQKRWRELVRGLGSIIDYGPAEIHHPAGRTAKHNKVDIGHWWVLPLTKPLHRLLDDDKTEFDRRAFGFPLVGRWDAEKLLFQKVLARLEISPPDEVIEAIMDYRR